MNNTNNENKSFSITRYALQSFRHYGGKSIILMIALAASLVLGLLNISTSSQRTMELAAISSSGDAHFQFLDVSPEQIEAIKNRKEVKWAGEYVYFSRTFANAPDIPEQKCKGVFYVESLGIMDGYKIARGRAPQKIDEVAIAPHVAEYLGIEAKVGAEFEIELYNTVDAIPMKFIVSGIIQDQEFLEIMGKYDINVSKEFVEANANFEISVNAPYDSRNVLVKLKKGYDVYSTAANIAREIGIESDRTSFNHTYIYVSLSAFEDQLIFGIVVVFFMLVGALIMYNAFNIIIAKRTRHFGLLTLIGASKKQIRKCVYIEAALNLAIALPIGLLLGTFLSWAVMPLLSGTSVSMPAVYHISLYSYILTVVVTLLMVALGALVPARRAGKISPVEAAKFSPGGIKTKSGGKPKEKISLTALSRLNLFRRKGTGGIVVSLSIVGVLFISIAVVLFSTFNSLGGMIKQSMASDIRVTQKEYFNGEKPIFPESIVEQITSLDGVLKSHVFYCQPYRIPGIQSTIYVNGVEYEDIGYIFGVDDEIMLEYLSYGGKSDLATFENPKNVLSFMYIPHIDGKDITVNGFALRNDYDLTFDIYANEYDEEPIGQTDLHISEIADIRDVPRYIDDHMAFPVVIMPLDSFKANGFDLRCDTICLDIDETKHESIAAALAQICAEEENIQYQSFVAKKKEYENQFMSLIILIFAALGIVFAVGLLNLISSTFIGVEQRKKELGVLSAIGLSQKELKKMLKWEGAWVSVFSSAISIAGGCFLGWLFYLWTERIVGDYMKLSLPIVPIIAFCLVYIFVPYIISSISVHRLLKNTTVELMG
ncbi:MAG: ABC transporter permease, partial [Oscillospiraceae bacterium]|nr:ABC transporter permease [Oscillospiraceae bacterium]